MESRTNLIDGIRKMNPTANISWLLNFDENSLKSYLEHLSHALRPRGKSGWVRDGETTAIVKRIATTH